MNTSFGTSNKFSVLQQVQQPQPKGEKIIKSIPGPVPNVPSKQLKEQAVSEKEKQIHVSENRNNSNNRGRGEYRGYSGSRGANRGGRGTFVDRSTLDKLRDPDQPPKRNKRIYDKNSNVPKNESKKGGVGTGNWGAEKDDPLRGVDDAKKELDAEKPIVDGKVQDQPLIIEEKEPEDKTITLKQYQEQLAALAPKFEPPKRREAGEGEKVDLNKYVVLKKEDDDELERVVIKAKKEKKKQPKKQTLTLSDLNPADDRRYRKPYNNNYNNNNYNNNKKPKKVNISIEDTDSFPALK